ncbi:MAG TPA: hypothetical protein VIK07_11705, partial [Bacteroidales bacterium]
MIKINVLVMLNHYKRLVFKDKISFIKNANEYEKQFVLDRIEGLISKFKKYDKEKIKAKGKKSLSDFIETHEIHKIGSELWNKLCSLSLNHIEPTSKGNSKLLNFLEEATKFEDLLYGLESYYRDHTLHSLWVYLIGEYLMRGALRNLQGDNFNWYIYNDISSEKEKYDYPAAYVDFSKIEFERKFIRKVNEKKDAIWCIIALCHDLGYSLEKLDKLNDKVEKVLRYFTISNKENVGYSFDVEHQYLVAQFLELMAMDVRIVPSEEYRVYFTKHIDTEKTKSLNEYLKSKKKLNSEFSVKEEEKSNLEKFKITPEVKRISELILTKCYRDDSTYWRLCQSLEKKKHGILSSYLLFKVLGIFAESSVMGPGEEWGLSDEEAIENIIHGNILFAMAQHTFDFAHLNEINSLSDILVLSDDLEEFSRFGRQLLSRKYYDTTAKVNIIFTPNYPSRGSKNVELKITYQVEDHIRVEEYYSFFFRKAGQLCKIYSLGEESDTGFCKLNTIKMITSHKTHLDLYFQLSANEDNIEGKLPECAFEIDIKGEKKKPEKGVHKMKCLDDKLYIKMDD